MTGYSVAVVYGTGIASAGPYAAALDFEDASELAGVYQKADNTVATLTVASADPIAETVTFNENVPSGAILAIYRVTPKTQTTEFRRHGSFEVDKHDDAIDKIYHILQELGEKADRGLRIHETQRNVDKVLHYDLSQKVGAAIRINADGDGFDFLDDAEVLASANQDADLAEAHEAAALASSNQASSAASLAASKAATAVANLEAIEDIVLDKLDTTVVDLGTAGGTASVGGTYLVDTSSGPVTVDLALSSASGVELRVKSVSPYRQTITLDPEGAGTIEGYSSIDMWHPGHSLTLARGAGEWQVINEANDTPSLSFPKLTYNDADSVDVSARPGRGDFISAVMSDGKVWHYDGASINVDLTASGNGGLDTGSVASDTFYYIYMVPSGNAWRELSAVASISDPDTGPTGYDNYLYVGAITTELSSTDILKFVQVGAKFYIYNPDEWRLHFHASAMTGNEATWTKIQASLTSGWPGSAGTVSTATPLEDIVPTTYCRALIQIENLHFSGSDWAAARIVPSDAPSGGPSFNENVGLFADSRVDVGTQAESDGCVQKWVPRSEDGHLYVAISISGSSSYYLFSTLRGWEDRYLVG